MHSYHCIPASRRTYQVVDNHSTVLNYLFCVSVIMIFFVTWRWITHLWMIKSDRLNISISVAMGIRFGSIMMSTVTVRAGPSRCGTQCKTEARGPSDRWSINKEWDMVECRYNVLALELSTFDNIRWLVEIHHAFKRDSPCVQTTARPLLN